MLKLKLKIDGKDKTIVPQFISGRVFRDTVKLAKMDSKDEADFNEDVSDEIVQYICNVFSNQFTIDEFYDGIDAREILPTFLSCIDEVMGKMKPKSPSPNK